MNISHISLFKKNSHWYIQYVDENGKRKQKSTGCDNKNDAVKKLSSLRDLIETPKKTLLFSAFQTEILQYAEKSFSRYTRNIYSNTFNNFRRHVGDPPLENLSMKHIDMYKAVRLQTVSEKSVNRELQVLKSSLYFATRWGYIVSNPFSRLPMCRVPERKPRYLNQLEAKILLEAIKEPWFKEIVFFALSTGMRRSEIVNLRWKNVDLNNRLITIESDANYKTKYGKARVIPINDVLFEVLLNKYDENHVDLLFEIDGKSIHPDRLTDGFSRYRKLIGFDQPLTFHHCRHTFATWLIQAGVSIYEVQRLLGHSTIKMTEIYAHLIPDNLQKSVNRIGLRME